MKFLRFHAKISSMIEKIVFMKKYEFDKNLSLY